MMAVRTKWFDDQIQTALQAEHLQVGLTVEDDSQVSVSLQVCSSEDLYQRAHLHYKGWKLVVCPSAWRSLSPWIATGRPPAICQPVNTERNPPANKGLQHCSVQVIQPPSQVVLLGAGMDTRAWRAELPPGMLAGLAKSSRQS